MSKKWLVWFGGMMAVIALIFGGVIARYALEARVKVMFLDVGQGDAILISQGSNQILVDGGRDGTVLLDRLGRALPFWDRTIEAVVVTHPDEDHAGGLPALISRYRVGVWLVNRWNDQASGSERFIESQPRIFVDAREGTNIVLSSLSRMEILFPSRETVLKKSDTNASSVVAKIMIGPHSFLLTGDLPSREESILHPGSVEVLKVAHHGSQSSTTDALLNEVRPRDAIISVGEGNRYGHPSAEVLSRLNQRGIHVYRTDKQGTILYQCEEGGDSCDVVMEE